MVGTSPDGQLTRAAADLRVAAATPADDAAIRQLLRANPMRGAISLTFEREPAYASGTGIAGARDDTVLAFSGAGLAGMGRCTTRDCWLNGRVQRVSYLAEMRLAPAARGSLAVVRAGYRWLEERHREQPAAFMFTSIAADNTRALRLLERGLPGFPEYTLLGELTTLLIPTRGARASAPPLETATVDELADFFNRIGATRNLSAAWTPEQLAGLATHNLRIADFGVLRQNGGILAAGALWDQRPFRQMVIRGYSRGLAAIRPIVNTVGRALAMPRLPPPGSVLSHAFLSPIAGAGPLLPELVNAFRRRAAGRRIEFLTLALPSSDQQVRILQERFRCRRYLSRIYRVRWPDTGAAALDHRPILPDVALL